MANHGCINGTLEGTDKYSSPVPFIGLYIAIFSTVCSFLMLYDIVCGFIKRQRWLPCKLFKLNSITLSLIGVVVKLTLDLTTPMPSALDQLSKLTGTTSLCIFMCYIFPSLGDMKDSTNMYALSILVITVFVNICLQLSTGVIALFIPEHIAILSLMLVLLLILWQSVWASKTEYSRLVGVHKTRFLEGTMAVKENFLRRLKVCYLYSYDSNPQFVACREKECGVGGDLSLLSLFILIQAAVRSIILKKEVFCTGESSDYRWSMEAIVATQFATVAIGTFSCYSRRFTMTFQVKYHVSVQKLISEPYLRNPIWKHLVILVNAMNWVYNKVISVNYQFFSVPITVFNFIKLKVRSACKTDSKPIGEWETLFDKKRFNGLIVERDFVGLQTSEWRQRKSANAMEKLIEESKKRTSDLCNLLTRIFPPPRQSAGNPVIGNGDVVINHPRYQGSRPKEWISFELLCITGSRLLPLVALVRLAEVAVPKSLSRNMILTLREAFATLYFIEKHMRHNIDTEIAEIAKAVWINDDFRLLLPQNLRDFEEADDLTLDHAFRVIEYIDNKVHLRDLMDMQVRYIRMLLTLPRFSSVEELGYFIEDLFVDLFDPLLAQLPEAIFNAVYGSPVEKFEHRVEKSLEHLCKFESWEGIHRWKPPKECLNCIGLVTTESSIALRAETFGEAFANATPEDESRMLVERLYSLVNKLEHHNAGKITRMLMKLDPLILMLLVSSPEALKAKVAEAMDLLRNNNDAMFVVSKFEYQKFTS